MEQSSIGKDALKIILLAALILSFPFLLIAINELFKMVLGESPLDTIQGLFFLAWFSFLFGLATSGLGVNESFKLKLQQTSLTTFVLLLLPHFVASLALKTPKLHINNHADAGGYVLERIDFLSKYLYIPALPPLVGGWYEGSSPSTGMAYVWIPSLVATICFLIYIKYFRKPS